MKRLWALNAIFASLAVMSMVLVPVGHPYTYGRITNSHYSFYWAKEGGEVVDNMRLVMQLGVLGAIWFACYVTSAKKKDI